MNSVVTMTTDKPAAAVSVVVLVTTCSSTSSAAHQQTTRDNHIKIQLIPTRDTVKQSAYLNLKEGRGPGKQPPTPKKFLASTVLADAVSF